jgi:hypothetical protein
MCKVLTQDKSRLIDVSNTDIYIEKVGGQNIFNISVYRYNRSVVLGTYRTEGYAMFVLDLLGENLGRENYFKMSEFDSSPE